MNAMFELRNNTSQKNDTCDKNQNDHDKDYIQIDIEEPIVKTEITHTLKARPKSEEEGEKYVKDDIDSDDTKSIDNNESAKDETDARGRKRQSSSSFIELSEGAVAEILDDVKDQKQSNSYAAKKTVAQGMMDIALITANANQLRYIIEFNRNSSTFYLNITLIVVSLLLQVGVGISLIFKGRMDLRGESKHENAKRINNYVVVGVFLVTIINVFIASFTITGNNGSH